MSRAKVVKADCYGGAVLSAAACSRARTRWAARRQAISRTTPRNHPQIEMAMNMQKWGFGGHSGFDRRYAMLSFDSIWGDRTAPVLP